MAVRGTTSFGVFSPRACSEASFDSSRPRGVSFDEKHISYRSDVSYKSNCGSSRAKSRIFKLESGTRQRILSSISRIEQDLITGLSECYYRHVVASIQWLSEVKSSFDPSDPGVKDSLQPVDVPSLKPAFSVDLRDPECTKICAAKSFLENGECLRAAYVTRLCTKAVGVFLHFYSRYLAIEKTVRNKSERVGATGENMSKKYKDILDDVMHYLEKEGITDGYLSYLCGLLLVRLKDPDSARSAFADSVCRSPLNWDAWFQLSETITSREMERRLGVPSHWMKFFFLVHLYQRLEKNSECVALVEALQSCGFGRTDFLNCQVAAALHNLRYPDSAVGHMMEVRERDPYRSESMDLLSNLFYVQELRVELSDLALSLAEFSKYRPETQCVLGNLFSLRGEHDKAVTHFQRVLKLEPKHKYAWTVLGHEFFQMTYAATAIECYRKAVDVNPRDFRAWYGLGQAYEVLRMHNYSLYYYKRATWVQPYDVRLYVAMGVAYESLHQRSNTRNCFERACALDDPENMALFRLAKIYAEYGLDDAAASTFSAYLRKAVETGLSSPETVSRAHKYLALYFVRKDKLKLAQKHALGLQGFVHAREDAKRCLELISRRMAALGISKLEPGRKKGRPKFASASRASLVSAEGSTENAPAAANSCVDGGNFSA